MESFITLIQEFTSSIGPFFIALGLLIFVHELGHFLVAKFYKVRVETFSLGFGKKILQFQYGETTYCVSLIPLGGYVKMFGDDPSAQIADEDRHHSFLHKPVGQRIAIVLAGPLMNLLFAAILYSGIAIVGKPVAGPQVGDIDPQSTAATYGFRSGDVITAIDGVPTTSWKDVTTQLEQKPEQTLSFEIQRNGKETITLTAKTSPTKNPNILSTTQVVGTISGLQHKSNAAVVATTTPETPTRQAGFSKLEVISSINGESIHFFRQLEPVINKHINKPKLVFKVKKYSWDEKTEERIIEVNTDNLISGKTALQKLGLESPELYLLKIKEGSPAHNAGLLSGDRIHALNGQTINEWNDVLNTVKAYDTSSKGIAFEVLREGKLLKLNIHPSMTQLMTAQGSEEQRFTVGIIPAVSQTYAPFTTLKYRHPLKVLNYGIVTSLQTTKNVSMGILRLFQGRVSSKNVGGVITIGRFAGKSFRIGISAFLDFLAVISINLFIINLFPIPILDGGHLVFFSIEAIKGAPVSLKKMEMAQQVGLVILMTLMVFALFNDITNLVSTF